MKKDIKFRAYLSGGGEPIETTIIYSEPFPAIFWKNIEDYPLKVDVVQFTGLVDKNGKDIYQGDVVEYTSKAENGIAYITNEKNVSISLSMIWISQDTSSPRYSESIEYFGYKDELKIIGNIHQNPEFLK